MRKSGSAGGGAQPLRVQSSTAGRTSGSSRFSLYGTGSASKRSITPSGHGPATKQNRPSLKPYSASDINKDPRPTSKEYVQMYVSELVDFLVACNYPFPLTPKQLSQPSSNDFRNVFEFLITFLKPNYKLPPKVDVEAPFRLKCYGYPFTIPKSHFQTIGVQHTWPMILLALTWMRKNIQGSMDRYFNDVVLPCSDDEVGKQGLKKLLFDYVDETYELYMNGDDTFDEQLACLEKKLANDSGISDLILVLKQEKANAATIHKELSSQLSELPRCNHTLTAVLMETDKCDKHVTNLEAQLKEINAWEKVCLDDEKTEIAQCEAFERERANKMQLVARQMQSGVNFQQMMTKVNALKRQIANKEVDIHDRDANIQNLMEKLAQMDDQAEMAAKECNKMTRELMLKGANFDIRKDMTESEKAHIRFQARDLCTNLKNQSVQLDEELMKVKTQEESWDEMIQDNDRKKASLNNVFNHVSAELNCKKDAHQNKLQELRIQTEAKKAQADSCRAELTEKLKRLQEDELAVKNAKLAFEKKEEEFCTLLEEVMHVALEHKRSVQGLVKQMDEEVEKKCDAILHQIP